MPTKQMTVRFLEMPCFSCVPQTLLLGLIHLELPSQQPLSSCKKQLHRHLLHEAFLISPGVTQALLPPRSNSTCRSTFHAGYVTVPLGKKSQADMNRYLTDQILI